MDLNWLRDFECLSRLKNFTRAADERNITQSAFSRRIKALESWVGLPLVNRATYPVQLTEAGRQFLPVATAAVSQLAEARHSLRDADRGENRFIRFSVLPAISVNYLSGRIEELQGDLPALRTRVISDQLSTCCELLVEGAVDIMLCYAHAAVSPMIDEAAFERKDLLTDRLVPVAATAAAQQHGWRLGAGADAIPYLAYERSSFLGMVVENIVGRGGLNVETIYVDSLVEAIKRRMMAGRGVAWMPQTAIAEELSEGQVVQVGDESWVAPMTISAFADTRGFDPMTRAVWDLL